MNYLLKRVTEPSTYAGLAGALLFAGGGDLTAMLNIAGMVASVLAMVLPEKRR